MNGRGNSRILRTRKEGKRKNPEDFVWEMRQSRITSFFAVDEESTGQRRASTESRDALPHMSLRWNRLQTVGLFNVDVFSQSALDSIQKHVCLKKTITRK